MADLDAVTKDGSPFPSQSDMDLDMWRVTRPMPDGTRRIKDVNDTTLIHVMRQRGDTSNRDALARRIEMLGDLYEALRQAHEKLDAAKLDATREAIVLSEFCSPKPFMEGQ